MYFNTCIDSVFPCCKTSLSPSKKALIFNISWPFMKITNCMTHVYPWFSSQCFTSCFCYIHTLPILKSTPNRRAPTYLLVFLVFSFGRYLSKPIWLVIPSPCPGFSKKNQKHTKVSSTFYVPHTILGTGNTAVNKRNSPCSHGAKFAAKMGNKSNNKNMWW